MVDSLFLMFLDFFDLFEVFVRFLWFLDSLGALWYYGEALRDVVVILTITALELKVWFLEIDLDTMFSKPSVSQKDGCIPEFHNI